MDILKRSRFMALIGILCLALSVSAAWGQEARFLAKEDIVLYGMQLTAAPAKQTVPKNIATIVSTFMQVPSLPSGAIPPLPPDATVKGTLRGPGLENPIVNALINGLLKTNCSDRSICSPLNAPSPRIFMP